MNWSTFPFSGAFYEGPLKCLALFLSIKDQDTDSRLYQDSGLLQQGSDITGGLYVKVDQLSGLLQYLTWLFLPSPGVRKMLGAPPPVRVDYRAACFCHRQLVDVGFVCSVCLSIFCRFNPVCTTCHSVFKTPGLPPSKKKKVVPDNSVKK